MPLFGLSNVMIRAGKRITFVNIEIISVIDVNKPSAIIPPNDEKAKIIKPAKSTMDVYMMLLPVSMILSLTATGIKKLLDKIS